MARTQVQTELIATNAISGTIIADNAITATHIAQNSISGILIPDSGITTTMIASNNVTAAKIVTGAVANRHLASTVISSQSAVTAASGDYVLIGDTSDSNNLKKALVSDFGVSGIDSSADATAITIDSSENVTMAGTLGTASTIRVTTDGSASAPCYQVGGDADTGMYQPAANQLGFTVAGTQKAYFTTTAFNLDSSLTSGFGLGDDVPIKLGNSGDFKLYHDASNSYIEDAGTGNLYIKSNADNYINLISAAADANLGFTFRDSGGTQRGYMLFDSDDYIMTFGTSAERMRIGSTGKASWSAGGIGAVATQARDFTFYTEGVTNGVAVHSNDYRLIFMGGAGSSGAGMDTGYLQIENAGTAKIALNSNGNSYFTGGNVGIGTDSPGNMLETNNSANYTKHWRIHRPGTAEFGIGTVGSHLHISSGSSMPASSNKGLFMQFNTGEIGIWKESVSGIPLDVSGVIRASTGIEFGTDTAAANQLDDYEEGTWGPTIANFGGTQTSFSHDCKYTRVGRLVTFSAKITSNGGTTTWGTSCLIGLPITGVSNSGMATWQMPAERNTSVTANHMVPIDMSDLGNARFFIQNGFHQVESGEYFVISGFYIAA